MSAVVKIDRPKAAKVIADLDKFADWEPPESPRATAMREAAAVLRALSPPGHKTLDPLENPELQGHLYRSDISESIDPNKGEKTLRFVVYRDVEKMKVLGFMLLTPPEVFDMGQYMIRQYDKMEGIE